MPLKPQLAENALKMCKEQVHHFVETEVCSAWHNEGFNQREAMPEDFQKH